MKQESKHLLSMLGLIALLSSAPQLGFTKSPPSHPVDLNSASAAELMQLPGIGKSRADAILTARQLHPFASPQDLLKVPGIGAKRLAQIAAYIQVDGNAAAANGTDTTTSAAPSPSTPAAGRR